MHAAGPLVLATLAVLHPTGKLSSIGPQSATPPGAAGNTSAATAASGIVPAHCGPPTASGFHLRSLTLGSKEDRWRRATVTHAAGPLVVETLAVSYPTRKQAVLI